MKKLTTTGSSFKFVLVLFTSAILWSCAKETVPEINNDLTSMYLKGRIKSIKEYSFEAVERAGNVEKGIRKTESGSSFDNFDKIIIFNESGNIKEKSATALKINSWGTGALNTIPRVTRSKKAGIIPMEN